MSFKNLTTLTAVSLTARDVNRAQLAMTITRMAGFLLLGNSSCIALISYIHVTMQNLHFHRPWRSDAGVEPPWTVSRRFIAGCARFMSQINANMA
jgi:hypothetical protein